MKIWGIVFRVYMIGKSIYILPYWSRVLSLVIYYYTGAEYIVW